MLILPPGHAEEVQQLRRLTMRERWLIRGVLVSVALAAVVVAISLVGSGQSSGRGCLHLTVAGPVGAGEINECGVAARHTCGTARQPGEFAPGARADVIAACRKAGLSVG